MNKCPRASECPLFKNSLVEDVDLTDLLKRVYCNNDFENCARYFISRNFGVDRMPDDLKPYQSTKAKQLYLSLIQMEDTLTAS